jgi:hypothetical protein
VCAVQWAIVDEVAGDLQAELLRGLLQAQGIEVLLSQESAGHSVYALGVGELGKVEILVPMDRLEEAQAILNDYYAGKFELPDEDTPQDDQPMDEDRNP